MSYKNGGGEKDFYLYLIISVKTSLEKSLTFFTTREA